MFVDPEVLGHDTVVLAAGSQTESVKMATQDGIWLGTSGGGRGTVALADSMTPGLAVALVSHGPMAWAAGYGVADQATGEPVTSATRFQAASVAKPVTAWGVLRLVEQGRIGLDEPVVGHLRALVSPTIAIPGRGHHRPDGQRFFLAPHRGDRPPRTTPTAAASPTLPSLSRRPPGWSPPRLTWPASSRPRSPAPRARPRDEGCSARSWCGWPSPPPRH